MLSTDAAPDLHGITSTCAPSPLDHQRGTTGLCLRTPQKGLILHVARRHALSSSRTASQSSYVQIVSEAAQRVRSVMSSNSISTGVLAVHSGARGVCQRKGRCSTLRCGDGGAPVTRQWHTAHPTVDQTAHHSTWISLRATRGISTEKQSVYQIQ